MKKQNDNLFMTRIVYLFMGIVLGVVCFFIYLYVPEQKTALILAGSIGAVLLLLYGVRRNTRLYYENAIGAVVKALADGSGGDRGFYSEESDNMAVQDLYNGIEDLRQNLRKKEVLQSAAMDITNSMALNLEFYNLINVLMNRLIEEMDANWGVFYIYHGHTERLELKKALGLSKKVYQDFDVLLGEGLVGIAAQGDKIAVYDNIPSDIKFENRTFLGDITPKNIMAIPVKCQDKLVAVLAFGSIYDFSQEQLQLVKLLQYPMGYAIANSLAYEKMQDLSKELKLQNQLIQNMNAEMSRRMAKQEEDFENGVNKSQ